jgi:hypothetical protein
LPANSLARPYPLVPGLKPQLSAKTAVGTDPRDELLQGSIALVSQGCDDWTILIISVPETVYFLENPNFLSWYERWLDELLAGRGYMVLMLPIAARFLC